MNKIIDTPFLRVIKDETVPKKYGISCDEYLHFMYDNTDIQFNHWNFLKVFLVVGGMYSQYLQFRICHRFGKYETMAKLFNRYNKNEEFKNRKM
jgi:hypothetical protein